MIICQWHLDIAYGKQAEAVKVMRAWGAEKFSSSEFRRARGARLLAGFVGPSASHLVDEYTFDSLADYEAALAAWALRSSGVIRRLWHPTSCRGRNTGSSIGCWKSHRPDIAA